MKKSYCIRNKETGLYSTGGSKPSFSPIGKVWTQIGHLKSHLLLFKNIEFYVNSEIVEMVEVENNSDDYFLQKYQETARIQRGNSADLAELLRHFVKTGACYTDEFKDMITNDEHPHRDIVNKYVPHQMIDKFEVYHNKGIQGCTPEELGAIILTAEESHIKMYKL